MDKCAIFKADLKQLAYDGLLEFEDLKEVRVHDLYKELVAREAAASGRFVDDRIGMNYAEAKRLLWRHGIFTVPNFEELQFPKLELLIAFPGEEVDDQFFMQHWHMPHLRMLEIEVDLETLPVEWGKMTELTWLRLRLNEERNGFYHQMLEDISQLRHLLFLSISGSSLSISVSSLSISGVEARKKGDLYRLCLNSFVNLQYLTLESVANLEEISGLDSLINLKCIDLFWLDELLKVGHFSSRSTQLQFVIIKECRKLREIQGLGDVPNLKELRIRDTASAFGFPELLKVGHFSSRSTQLETVELQVGKNVELQLAGDVPNLEKLTVERCLGLDEMSNDSLQHVHLSDCFQALEYLELHVGSSTVGIYGLPKLKVLCISGDSIKEISFIHCQLPRLKSLEISGCKQLQDINFSKLTSLSNLEKLSIVCCDCLEEVDWSCLNNLTNLKVLSIEGCRRLKMIKGKPNGINHTLQHLSAKGGFTFDLEKVEGLELLKGLPDKEVTTLLQQLDRNRKLRKKRRTLKVLSIEGGCN